MGFSTPSTSDHVYTPSVFFSRTWNLLFVTPFGFPSRFDSRQIFVSFGSGSSLIQLVVSLRPDAAMAPVSVRQTMIRLKDPRSPRTHCFQSHRSLNLILRRSPKRSLVTHPPSPDRRHPTSSLGQGHERSTTDPRSRASFATLKHFLPGLSPLSQHRRWLWTCLFFPHPPASVRPPLSNPISS